MLLPRQQWLEVVRNAPLVSIDLVLSNAEGRFLLGWRNNEPARDRWFVPGGVIRKGERLDAAFQRIAQDELGLQLQRSAARLLGVYEHFYEENFARVPELTTHYVVQAYACQIRAPVEAADVQHRELRWFTREELLKEPAVHPYTRAYFADAAGDVRR